MKFKLLSLTMALLMVFSVTGCKKKEIEVETSSSETENVSSEGQSSLITADGKHINPLTGIAGLDEAAVNKRPVAIMVNNVSVAQGVQSGVGTADIVYEAYTEGGITRLLAVYKDYTKIPNVGSVRSARYSYVDLAMGHDAIYVHAGINASHCEPHVKETGIDNINLNSGATGKYQKRISNGLATEHTLYATKDNLLKCFDELKWRTDLKTEPKAWQKFASESSPVTLSGGAAKEISVTMSAASTTKFVYDDTTGKYNRYKGTTQMKEYFSKEVMAFKNVLVLNTDVTLLGFDGTYNIWKTELNGGEGWYFSEGTYQKVKWSKGGLNSAIKLTNTDGSTLTYNAGNTWVCLHDKTQSMSIDGTKQ